MSRQMLSSKEPLSAPWLGARMFPGHQDAVRISLAAGIARLYQCVDHPEFLHVAIALNMIESKQKRGHDTQFKN